MLTDDKVAAALGAALQKVARWRMVFASWQLGSRTADDGECRAVRHHREGTILQRIELSAVTRVLIAKGVFTEREFQEALIVEAEMLDRAFEGHFPGFSTSEAGVHLKLPAAAETMADLGFPE